jgi:hypothetical protein
VAHEASEKHSSRATQRQIEHSTAVCQERLLATHVRHVLALVDLVSDELPFDDALDIYVRILRLTPEQARNIGSRALAELGRRSVHADTRVLKLEDTAVEEEPDERVRPRRSQIAFSRLRRRIRGRVHDELRYRIDLAAARAEDAIFDTHVENALVFVKALAEGADAPEAVEVYLDTMMLPEGMGDVIFNRALRMIADESLPPAPALESVREAPGIGAAAHVGERHG